ncbi:hypothetical protein [Falsigemmobacter faecalis]|uniref:Secreted protein n=1 Tax=Falsigemmobacter faecalis TaxID=2488730 RepID=A0A3P3DPK7_9RHOB|nr:hypothetical protein [Falsigemmobacter faecalis]RRH75864.1 hypothetical protein EG244_08045 [Falsigemmobacter faecalis]
MRLTFALMAALGLAGGNTLPATAQAPALVSPGLVEVLGKVDALATAKGADQIEALMAVCLTMGATPQVVEMVLGEAGWTQDAEFSDEMLVILRSADPDAKLWVQLEPEAETCGIGTYSLGGAKAHELATGLLRRIDPGFNTVTEGTGTESCTKYDLASPLPGGGQIYVSVFDDSGEEFSCLPSPDVSLTTFAFVST